jgi:hypothetical protein
MHLPATGGNVEDSAVENAGCATQDDERHKNEGREKSVEKQYGDDGIGLECLLLE